MDDSLPVLQVPGMRVQEGVRKTITEFELKAMDADTEVSMFTEVYPDCAFKYDVVVLYLFFIKCKKTIVKF